MNKFIIILSSSLALTSVIAHADQQIQDDLVVVGSGCFGFDCVNGESFGFDTIRLKENNVRIKFIDTSSSSSFPTSDWEIEINDSANGGSNHFSINDVDAGRTPFSIIQGAPSNSLYVGSSGYVGLGTSAPVVQFEIKDGNTPTVRLNQDASSGFASQAWDVAGNETNFFIRDVTNSSKLPFRITSGASNNSIFVAADGDVGLETSTPDGLLDVAHSADANNHALLISPTSNVGINIDNGQLPNGLLDVQTTGGISRLTVASDGNVGVGTSTPSAPLDIERTTSTVPIAQLTNAGPSRLHMTNSTKATSGNDAQTWSLNSNGTFRITVLDSSNKEFELDANGNLVIHGALTQGSDINSKENITPVDGEDILNKLTHLPISTWNYKNDGSNIRHLGPMAQDFYKKFKLGATNKGIASLDSDGIALISIQQLNKKLIEKEQTIKILQHRLTNLEGLVEKLAANTQGSKILAYSGGVQ